MTRASKACRMQSCWRAHVRPRSSASDQASSTARSKHAPARGCVRFLGTDTVYNSQKPVSILLITNMCYIGDAWRVLSPDSRITSTASPKLAQSGVYSARFLRQQALLWWGQSSRCRSHVCVVPGPAPHSQFAPHGVDTLIRPGRSMSVQLEDICGDVVSRIIVPNILQAPDGCLWDVAPHTPSVLAIHP